MTEPAFDVLIVEDDETLRRQLAQLIMLWGYHARVAVDVASARAELARALPDIILTDLMLPDAPGYDLMKSSQQLLPAPIVVVITAYASMERAIEALKEGAYDFLLKPMSPPELMAALSRAGVAVSLRRARERADQLRYIGEVALTLAHEINNPLAVIMGELQLQLDEMDPALARAGLQNCLESANRIAGVVRKISALEEVSYQHYAGFKMIDLERKPPHDT